MSDQPALSVLIPWRQRDEIRMTLAANAPHFRSLAAEVLALNCGGDAAHLRSLILESGVAGVRQVDISAPRFNKSLALNIGISEAQAERVFVLDTDVILLDDALEGAMVCLGEQSFVTIEWLHESRPAALGRNPLAVAGNLGATLVNTTFLEFTFPDGTKIHHQASRRGATGRMRAGTGMLLANKRDLVGVQGYNSDLETWGWEDDDILVRLQYVLKLRRVQRGEGLHLSHGDDQRTLEGQRGRSDQLNFFKCCRNYNNGQFLGTYDADIRWASGKVSERTDLAGASVPRSSTIKSPEERRSVAFSGPADCGNDGRREERLADWDRRAPTLDELLLEAALRSSSLKNCDLLHVGIGTSRLARTIAPLCRHITGVAADEREHAAAIGLGLPDYHAAIADRYGEDFVARLPLHAYDLIVDSSFVSDVCCDRHWKRLMRNYVDVLSASGSILTARCGASPSGRWAPSDDDIEQLAGEFGMDVTKTGYGVYTFRKRTGV